MSQQDDSPAENSDFQELEKKLSGLKPHAPSEAFVRRMGHRLDAMERTRAEEKIVWMRFAPVAAAACVVLTSAFLFRDHLLQQQQVAGTDKTQDLNSIAAATAMEPAPVLHDEVAVTTRPAASNAFGQVLPASSDGFLSRTSHDAEFFGFDDNRLLTRRMEPDFENGPRLFIPEPETNLRYFIGPNEFFLVPFVAD